MACRGTQVNDLVHWMAHAPTLYSFLPRPRPHPWSPICITHGAHLCQHPPPCPLGSPSRYLPLAPPTSHDRQHPAYATVLTLILFMTPTSFERCSRGRPLGSGVYCCGHDESLLDMMHEFLRCLLWQSHQ
ncbi:hypothetical protein BDY19DRAFT_548565 [Irpex rosettiformis]|uniref:Uncharacterized protein n=1 Tax=Irpex rosettiformis TaxID=378272 RepID=A0ACB8TQC5_9APHY|nr:hypothetical protein BDY19DRAFT_548565 [Irpex rosettiformis]